MLHMSYPLNCENGTVMHFYIDYSNSNNLQCMVVAHKHISTWDWLIRVKPISMTSHVPCCTWIHYPPLMKKKFTIKVDRCFAHQNFSIFWGSCNTTLRSLCFILPLPALFLCVPFLATIVAFVFVILLTSTA